MEALRADKYYSYTDLVNIANDSPDLLNALKRSGHSKVLCENIDTVLSFNHVKPNQIEGWVEHYKVLDDLAKTEPAAVDKVLGVVKPYHEVDKDVWAQLVQHFKDPSAEAIGKSVYSDLLVRSISNHSTPEKVLVEFLDEYKKGGSIAENIVKTFNESTDKLMDPNLLKQLVELKKSGIEVEKYVPHLYLRHNKAIDYIKFCEKYKSLYENTSSNMFELIYRNSKNFNETVLSKLSEIGCSPRNMSELENMANICVRYQGINLTKELVESLARV